MLASTESLEHYLFDLVNLSVMLVEFIGLAIIVYGIMKEAYNIIVKYRLNFFRINEDNHLNSTLSSALEVLLAAEILKTITIRDYRNLIIIGVLVILRIAMTLLLVWETSHKVKHSHLANEINENENENGGEGIL